MVCGNRTSSQPAGMAGSTMLGMPVYGGAHVAGSGALVLAGGPAYQNPSLGGLRYVEVETAKYCNRTCPWCPNGHSGARRTQQLMPWPLFAKVAAELGAAGYTGFVALHNYNEPLANPRLHAELGLLRAAAPDAKPAIYTNGDLLSRDGLERLLEVGVRYLRVTRYPHRADVAPTEEALHRWLRQVGLGEYLAWRFGPVRQGLAARWEDEAAGVLVEVIRPSISMYNDRGGTALVPTQSQPRTEPCRMTETSLSIDYRGMVKMCCNVIPDSAPEHDRYVVGSVADAAVIELWNSDVMARWRARHAVADWSDSPACSSCSQTLPETRR